MAHSRPCLCRGEEGRRVATMPPAGSCCLRSSAPGDPWQLAAPSLTRPCGGHECPQESEPLPHSPWLAHPGAHLSVLIEPLKLTETIHLPEHPWKEPGEPPNSL